MRGHKCALCSEGVDSEGLGDGELGVRAINPLTLRLAWMHCFCLRMAVEDSHGQPATVPEFENRYDQWLHCEEN